MAPSTRSSSNISKTSMTTSAMTYMTASTLSLAKHHRKSEQRPTRLQRSHGAMPSPRPMPETPKLASTSSPTIHSARSSKAPPNQKHGASSVATLCPPPVLTCDRTAPPATNPLTSTVYSRTSLMTILSSSSEISPKEKPLAPLLISSTPSTT